MKKFVGAALAAASLFAVSACATGASVTGDGVYYDPSNPDTCRPHDECEIQTFAQLRALNQQLSSGTASAKVTGTVGLNTNPLPVSGTVTVNGEVKVLEQVFVVPIRTSLSCYEKEGANQPIEGIGLTAKCGWIGGTTRVKAESFCGNVSGLRLIGVNLEGKVVTSVICGGRP